MYGSSQVTHADVYPTEPRACLMLPTRSQNTARCPTIPPTGRVAHAREIEMNSRNGGVGVIGVIVIVVIILFLVGVIKV